MKSKQMNADKAPAQAGFTSGPWHVDTSNGEFCIANDHDQIVMLIGGGRWLILNREDRDLIISAPALLDACRAFERALSLPGSVDWNAIGRQARAAIALALSEGGKA